MAVVMAAPLLIVVAACGGGDKEVTGLVLAVSALLIVSVACGGDGEKEVSGLVLEAVERNLVEIEYFRVRDDAGRVWEFFTMGNVGTSAAHLRQHQLSGERVRVIYLEDGGRLIAVDVGDAAATGRYGR